MINDKAKITTYNRYGVENIRQSEAFVNIIHIDKNSQVYEDFNSLMNNKVSEAMSWLSKKNIEYVWNEKIDGHLYRLYIPEKDILFDFEYYPVINKNYNYIRINYDTDITRVLGKLFPTIIIETSELQFYKAIQKPTNKFLRQNDANPIYYKDVFRATFTKDADIYQCMILRDNKIISNVVQKDCSVPYGTFMLLRYLNEWFEIPEIIIPSNLDDSYTAAMYELLNLPVVQNTPKRKIWWNNKETKWHISKDEKQNYIPFYFTERITYRYPK